MKDELKKRGPFDSLEQEAMLAIMRTSDLLENRMARLLREHGLTLTQYNVLRILRGEGKPLPCLEVASRMIQVAPAITRVVDQLLGMELITKTQSQADRRVFEIELTQTAARLLKKLDRPVLDLHKVLLAGVSETDLAALVRILELARNSVGD
ncbi:MAG: MarR family transcriptional regulator [bacterium]|nr:MarR family transcriptional regulator [bacterium]